MYFVLYDCLQENANIRLLCINCCFLINSLDYVTSNCSSYLTNKETNIADSKYKLLLKISNQLNNIESQKISRMQSIEIMFPLIFAMLLLDFELVYPFNCEEYVIILYWNRPVLSFIWLICLFFTVEETELVVTISFGTTHKGNAYVSN